MKRINRKEFLHKVLLFGSATICLPEFLRGDTLNSKLIADKKRSVNSGPSLNITEFGIIDLHCHPSLKMYLWDRHLWHRHFPRHGTNTVAMQDDIRELGSGFIKGIVVAHYLVEAAAEREWNLLRKLFPLIKRIAPKLTDKIEHEDASNFTQINIMIDEMESQVFLANKKQDKVRFVIARNFGEFKAAIAEGSLPIAHAIEGAHALGRNFPLSKKRRDVFDKREGKFTSGGFMLDPLDPDKAKYYIRNLLALKNRGVCMITIAHIFNNDIAHPTEGISPDEKITIGMEWTYTEKENLALTDIGKIVVEKMLDIGIIVDLTHCTPSGRQDVFRINNEREGNGKIKRPLTFTHVGAQNIFAKYDEKNNGSDSGYKLFNYYNVSNPEILEISKCGGVIGVVPENFWLTGCDTHTKGKNTRDFRNGIKYIVETIVHINAQTEMKQYDNVAIGTDFDGLADAPRDLHKASQLDDLITAIRAIPGITERQVKQITHLNSERLLEKGWID